MMIRPLQRPKWSNLRARRDYIYLCVMPKKFWHGDMSSKFRDNTSELRLERIEVKLSTLSPEEIKQFEKAKESEIQNWIETSVINAILRD